MLKSEVSLQFHGFHPSEFAKSYLEDIMTELREESPHGATLRGRFHRDGHVIKGMITIHSSAGRFFAVAADNKLRHVAHDLVHQIRRQLERQKSSRAQRRSLRDLPAYTEASAS